MGKVKVEDPLITMKEILVNLKLIKDLLVLKVVQMVVDLNLSVNINIIMHIMFIYIVQSLTDILYVYMCICICI